MHNNKNNSDSAATEQKQKAASDARQQKQKQGVSELSVLGTMLFSGSTANASGKCREEKMPYRQRYIYANIRSMLLTTLRIQSFPFALLEDRLRADNG